MGSATIPATMKALVASKYCKTGEYEIQEIPVPTLARPGDVLVRVEAAATTTGETQLTKGAFRLMVSVDFPFILGMEGSGVVVAVGSGVKSVKVGDEVIGGCWSRPFLSSGYRGWMAEYALAPENLLVAKPPHLTFEQAAGIISATITAYQSFREGLRLANQPVEGSLEGKTVFVPGALSATGSIGCQLAKNVYGAAKVVSTVSTPKLPLVEKYLGGGLVDQIIDYTKQDVVKEAGRGTVDFVYNTQWDLTGTFPLLKPETGVVVSIASIPPADTLKVVIGENNVPFFVVWVTTLVQWWYDWKLRGTNIKKAFVSGHPGHREDLERCAELIATGKVKPVSTVVQLDDIDAVRRAFGMVASGKGGLGSLVVKIR